MFIVHYLTNQFIFVLFIIGAARAAPAFIIIIHILSEVCLFCLVLSQPITIFESWTLKKIRRVLRLVFFVYIYIYIYIFFV